MRALWIQQTMFFIIKFVLCDFIFLERNNIYLELLGT